MRKRIDYKSLYKKNVPDITLEREVRRMLYPNIACDRTEVDMFQLTYMMDEDGKVIGVRTSLKKKRNKPLKYFEEMACKSGMKKGSKRPTKSKGK